MSVSSTFCSSADHGTGAGDGVDGEATSATRLSLVVTGRSSSVINLSTSSLAGSGPVSSHTYHIAWCSIYPPNFCSFFTIATTIGPVF